MQSFLKQILDLDHLREAVANRLGMPQVTCSLLGMNWAALLDQRRLVMVMMALAVLLPANRFIDLFPIQPEPSL